uniref:Uncharacterized protein n=1 Tax=Anguilla anguilla TaxID=7936 RepID=A0A0E9U4M7_ANGAN
MIQQTEVTCPKVNQFRQLYAKVINDKHDDVMAKFGAILAQGILERRRSQRHHIPAVPHGPHPHAPRWWASWSSPSSGSGSPSPTSCLWPSPPPPSLASTRT